MAPPSRFETLKDAWIDFVIDWFGDETLVDHTSMFLVLLTITHWLGFFIILSEPMTFHCNGFFRDFSVLEVGSLLYLFFALMAIFTFHLYGKIGSKIFVNFIHILHFLGILWILALTHQWFSCVLHWTIPRVFGTKPPRVLNYGSWTLNACLDHSTSCHNSYLYTQMATLVYSEIAGFAFSLYVFMMYKMDTPEDIELAADTDAEEIREVRGSNRRRGSWSPDSITNIFWRFPNFRDQFGRRSSANLDNTLAELVPRNSPESGSPEYGPENLQVHRRSEADASPQRNRLEFIVHRVRDFLASPTERESMV